jgi:hypothetical protein
MKELLFALALAGLVQGQEATIWGGDHVEMEVSAKGARLEFDCAHGTIDEAIKPDAKGAFTAKGTFTPERGGPAREDEESRAVKAIYSGRVEKDTMRLQIVVTAGQDRDEQEYVLVRNQRGSVFKCR